MRSQFDDDRAADGASAMTFDVAWFWDWVPGAESDPAQRSTWTDSVTALLSDWLGGQVAAARAAWPDGAPGEFPFTAAEMGSAVARELLERADEVPVNCRLIWGAGFVGDEARWLPLLVLAEFRQALPEDPAYLMAMVGAEGLEGDMREPNVEYVTTEHGDGIRVLALARSEDGELHGRVNAALRLETRRGTPAEEIDVLLTTQVSGLDQMAVIGPGFDVLMGMIADQLAAPPEDGAPVLRFRAADGDSS